MKNCPPKGLSPEARRWWRSIVKNYAIQDDAGLLVLEEGMRALMRLREAQDILGKEGITTVDRFKQVRQHPCTLIERDARNQLFKAVKSLNLDLDPSNPVGAPLSRV